MTIKFSTGFDNFGLKVNSNGINTYPTNGSVTVQNVLLDGYFKPSVITPTTLAIIRTMTRFSIPKSTNNNDPNATSSSLFSGRAISNQVADLKLTYPITSTEDKIVIGGAFQIMPTGSAVSPFLGFTLSTDTTKNVFVGVNGDFAAIYINNLVVATSAINVRKYSPWAYYELFISKTDSKIYLKVNNQAAADTVLPLSWAADGCGLVFPTAVNNTIFADDFYYAVNTDPLGPLYIKEFENVTSSVNAFSGTIATIANAPFNVNNFKQSEILSAEDRFTHGTILAPKLSYGSVLAVNHNLIMSSGNAEQPVVSERLRVNGVNTDTSLASYTFTTAPRFIQIVKEQAWTTSDLNALESGYINQ